MFTEHNKPQARSQNARIDHITAAVIGRLLASSGPRRTPPLPAVRRV